MPYAPLTEQEAAQVKAHGYDPAAYLKDGTTGDIIPAANAPVNPLAEAAKGFARGFISGSPVAWGDVAGDVDETVRSIAGAERSGLRETMQDLHKYVDKDSALAGDPRDPYFAGTLGNAAGNLAGLFGTGGIVAKVGQKALKGATPALLKNLMKWGVIGTGAAQAEAHAFEREMERQQREGETPSPGWALTKGAGVGAANALLAPIGPARLLGPAAEALPTTLGELGKKAAMNFAFGAGAGGGQNLVEQLLVEKKVDAGELAKNAAFSGAVQAAGGGLFDAAGMRSVAAKEALAKKEAAPAVEPTPHNAPVEAFKLDPERKAAMLSQYAKGKEYVGFVPNEVDVTANALFKLGVPIDEQTLDTLAAVWQGNDKNKKALEKAAEGIHHKFMAQEPAEAIPQDEVVKQKLAAGTELLKAKAEVEKYSSQLESLRTKMAKKSPGDAWLEEDMSQMRILEGLLTQAREHVHNFSRTMDMAERTGPAAEGGNAAGSISPFEAGAPAGAPLRETPIEGGESFVSTPRQGGDALQALATPGQQLGDWLQSNPNFGEEVTQGFTHRPAAPDAAAELQAAFAELPPAKQRLYLEAGQPQKRLTAPPSVDFPSEPMAGPAIPLPERLATVIQLADAQGDIRLANALRNAGLEHLVPVEARQRLLQARQPMGQPLREALQGYAEGEQGLPFGDKEIGLPGKEEVKRAELAPVVEPKPVDPHRPMGAYSGLPTEPLIKAAKEVGLLTDSGLVGLIGAVNTKLARRNPEAALLSYKAHELFPLRAKLQNEVASPIAERLKMLDIEGRQINPAREKLHDPRLAEWLHRKTDEGNWDISDLPKELQETGEFIRDRILLPHQRQREYGIGVERRDAAGNRRVTEPVDVEGYFPWGIDEKAFKAKRKGGEAWEPYRQAWLDAWQQHNKTDNPNWQTHAENALNEIFATAFDSTASGGQPLFSAVRKAHGVPLPRMFRSDDIVSALLRYADKYSADVAYGEVVQKNPALRRVLGLNEDPMGVETGSTDPVTWKEAPEAWAEAVRAGKEAGAEWARNADPANPPDRRIATLGADEGTKLFMHSYRQVPMEGIGREAKQAIAGVTQAASSLLMQSMAGLRDVTSSVVNSYSRAGLKNTIKGLMDTLRPGGVDRAVAAGASQYDPTIAQLPTAEWENGVGWFSKAMINAARAIRTGTGRQAMDQFSRALGYNVGYEAVMSGNGGELIRLFGPENPGKMDTPQLAEYVGNRLAVLVGNPADVRSLPAVMVPQANTVIGHLASLARWPTSQFNNFYQYTIKPALRGELGPLVRTLVGTTVGGTMVTALTQALTNTKPQSLSWAEWLKLPNDEQKLKELFYTWLGYDRAIGSMGIASDALYTLSANEAGVNKRPGGFEPQNAAWIVLSDMSDKVQGFNNSLVNHWTSPKDLMELGYELSKSAQLVRGLANWTEEKQSKRDQATFERLTGKSSETGENLGPQENPAVRAKANPFSLEKEVWKAKTEGDWQKLKPALVEYVKAKGFKGMPKLSRWQQSNAYYLWLRDIQGSAEARRQYQMDRQKDAEADWRERKMREVLMGK